MSLPQTIRHHMERRLHHANAVRQERGFSLLEVLVAASVLATGVAALAQLTIVAIRATDRARTTTVAAILAQQKMEQLRALAWGIDAFGFPITDTTTDLVSGEAAAGGPGLRASPEDSLYRDRPGYHDFVDRGGQSLGGDRAPPPGTVYVRRWSVTPLADSPDRTLVLQVLVADVGNRGVADVAGGGVRRPGVVRLATVKTRKAAGR